MYMEMLDSRCFFENHEKNLKNKTENDFDMIFFYLLYYLPS